MKKEELAEQIAKSANMAVRKVILSNNWWEEASEALLAFEKETDKPVKLIPTFSGKFRGVDAARAKELQDVAYCFYPLLTEKIGSGRAIFRLALRGKGKTFAGIILLTLLSIAIAFLPLFALQWIFNHIFDRGEINTMWQISWGLCLAAFSSAFFLYLRNRVLLRLDGMIANSIHPAIWHRLVQFQIGVFRKIAKSDLFFKITNVEAIREGLGGYTAQILLSALFSSIFLGAMLIFSITYTLLVLPFIILDLWGFIYFLRHHMKLKNHIKGIEGKRVAFLSQSLSGIKNVRAAGIEKNIFHLWKKYLIQEVEIEERIEWSKTGLELISLYLPIFLFGLILGAAILGWHTPPLGNFFAFYLALLNLCIANRELTQITFDMGMLLTRLKKTEKILEEPIESGTVNPGKLQGEIVFKNVKDFSFKIEPGERVGFLAQSFVARLLIGFESPTSGEILLDQKNLQQLDLQLVRRQIGVVFRTDGLFAGNIRENIDLGRNCSSSAIEKALKLSGFQEDLSSFPMGLNTLLPAGGDTLSGGQKQRLLLTRALASTPAILILDHAIDCLDQPSLDKIMTNLKTLPITQIYIGENEALLKKYTDRIISNHLH